MTKATLLRRSRSKTTTWRCRPSTQSRNRVMSGSWKSTRSSPSSSNRITWRFWGLRPTRTITSWTSKRISPPAKICRKACKMRPRTRKIGRRRRRRLRRDRRKTRNPLTRKRRIKVITLIYQLLCIYNETKLISEAGLLLNSPVFAPLLTLLLSQLLHPPPGEEIRGLSAALQSLHDSSASILLLNSSSPEVRLRTQISKSEQARGRTKDLPPKLGNIEGKRRADHTEPQDLQPGNQVLHRSKTTPCFLRWPLSPGPRGLL